MKLKGNDDSIFVLFRDMGCACSFCINIKVSNKNAGRIQNTALKFLI